MDENALVDYNAFDGFKPSRNVDEFVRIVLDEQKHSLTEEDRRILRDHENLRNEFHTLQNAIFSCESPSKSDDFSSWPDLAHAEPSTAHKSDVYFVDVEAIEQPSLATESVEPNTTDLDNTIANFIQDDNVKAEVLRLNQQIRLNATSIRALQDDAKQLMMEKMNFKRKLTHIERKIANFSPEEMRIRRIKRRKGTDSANTGHQKRTYFYRFGAPYFKTKDRFPADRNPDLLDIVRTNQLMHIRLPRVRRFLSHDAAFLQKNILKQLKAKRVEQLRKVLKDAQDRLKSNPDSATWTDEVRCIVKTIHETQAITRVSETSSWNIPVDFMALTQSARFTPDDYERIWRLTGSPTLTRGEFSEQEVAELKSLVKKYNEQDWDQIASEMSTKRSGFMCFTKYVTTEKKGKNRPWTKEENELLHNLCISMDSMSKSDSRFQFWRNIRCHFPHRSYTQIHSHWTYVLEPRLKKGRFTPEESKLMKKMMYDGKSFKEIALTLQNRSVVQVRTHLEKLLQKEINHGNWTQEEEEKLLLLIEKYGPHDWVTISNELGTRNRSQCRLKYAVYQKNNQRFSIGTRAPKEFWSEEENELFKELLCKYGPNFTKMSREMLTKTREQLRHKYHRSKRKAEFQNLGVAEETTKILRSSWTDKEVELFKQLLMTHGPQYRRISSFISTKTVYQLRHKYYTMRKEWNLTLPPINKAVGQDVNKSKHTSGSNSIAVPSASLHNSGSNSIAAPSASSHNTVTNSIAAPSTTVPVTYITEPPTALQLPEESFENSTPVSGAIDFSATSLDEVSTSDPLFVSSEQTEKKAAPRSRSRKRKPCENPSKYWSFEEVERFKNLLEMHGPDFKKISSNMPNRSSKQLRWKFYSMKRRGELSALLAAACKVASKNCKTAAISRADSKKSRKTVKKQPTQPDGGNFSENLSAVISEVLNEPSTPPETPAAAVPLDESAKQEQPMPTSSSLKATWTDEELETFKRLLIEYGPQCKRISEIMMGKTVSQLRYKYNCLKNSGHIPSFEKPDGKPKRQPAKRPKVSASRSVPGPSAPSEVPLPVELFENSNISMFVDSEDGFAGFPEESCQAPLSFQNLVPLRRIETIEQMEHPGSSYEQMIVPETMAEMEQGIGELPDGRNECLLSASTQNESVVNESLPTQNELVVEDAVVEVKNEIIGHEIKEEIRSDEYLD